MEKNNNKEQKSAAFLSITKNWVLPVVIGGLIAVPVIMVFNNSDEKNRNNMEGLDASYKFPFKLSSGENYASLPKSWNLGRKIKQQCFKLKQPLSEADLKVAKIAWKYFENNYQEKTGLFNAANKYPSTTMWDTGSALAATLAAEDFGLITTKEFDDKITALIKTLVTMKLFNGEAPNKVYNTKSMKMVTYGNKETPDGIGVSVLDIARLTSWLNTLACKHPKYKHQINLAMKRWNFDRLIKDGRMISLKRDPETGKIRMLKEGRLGYEQYAAKILEKNNHDLPISSTYNNKNRLDVKINDLTIATDNRTPEKFHANNSVVSESYIMDAIENGYDDENRPLIDNIYQVQKRRWEREGIVTAVTEDNVNRKPYFIYNTIFSGGKNWVAKTSKGQILNTHKTVSTKAAIAMALLYPDDEYSAVLFDKVKSAYDPEKGWYSGVYESGEGYNTSATANTNGVILSALLYKKYGSTAKKIAPIKAPIKAPKAKVVTQQCGVQ